MKGLYIIKIMYLFCKNKFYIYIIFTTSLFVTNAEAGNIHIVKYKNQADLKAYVVDY